MVKIVFEGVNAVPKRLADGTRRVYYYHRKTGIRLPDDPTTPEFAAELAALNADDKPRRSVAPDSVADLIARYRAAPEFKQLAEKTRRDYARYLDAIGAMLGKFQVAAIRRKHVRAIRDKHADTPRTANYFVQVIRLLMSFAVEEEMRDDNPALRPKLLRTGDGHRPWEEDEIEAFRERWNPKTRERIAFELLLNTGQRGGDVVSMARAHYRDGTIAVVQEKTGERVWVPASDELRAVLDPWLEVHHHLVILTTESGGAFGIDYFRHTMREAYRAAKLPEDLTTHGTRYTAATVLHELGCDWETIGSITGHATAQMVRKYVAKRRRARVAIGRLNRARAERKDD